MNEPSDRDQSDRHLPRRQFLQAAGVAGVAVGAAVLTSSGAALADDADHTLVGAWVESLTAPDGSFPPFQVYFTYMPGGGLVGTASIDQAPGLKSSPTHGAWRPLGGRRYRWTGHAFSFDDAGNLNGVYNIKEQLTLSGSGGAYSGSGTFEIVNGTGAIPLQSYNVSAQRLTT